MRKGTIKTTTPPKKNTPNPKTGGDNENYGASQKDETIILEKPKEVWNSGKKEQN